MSRETKNPFKGMLIVALLRTFVRCGLEVTRSGEIVDTGSGRMTGKQEQCSWNEGGFTTHGCGLLAK
jgi:hypothetical protein